MVPSSWEANALKRDGVMSSRPQGHPGHSSATTAVWVLPLAVIVTDCPQVAPPWN